MVVCRDNRGETSMKLQDFRELKPNEVAVVLDNGVEHVAISKYNQEGGDCGCCKNCSLDEAEVVVVRNALTGMVVWPDGFVTTITSPTIRLGKRDGLGWSYSNGNKSEI